MLQEFLLRLSVEKKQFAKEQENYKIFSLVNNDLAQLENKSMTIIGEIAVVEPIILELKSKCESLSKRDKILEVKFQTEFNNLKQPMVEHLLRHYKRRLRVDKIHYISLTCLVEMSTCLISNKTSQILPQEYLDFLFDMDIMDVMPMNLPAQIDAILWRSFCKLRRNKIELEIKV
jgi:hypothetical protein